MGRIHCEPACVLTGSTKNRQLRPHGASAAGVAADRLRAVRGLSVQPEPWHHEMGERKARFDFDLNGVIDKILILR